MNPIHEVLAAAAVALALAACSSEQQAPQPSWDAALDTHQQPADGGGEAGLPDSESADQESEAAVEVEAGSDGAGGATGYDRGLSAWVYESRQEWADAMNAHDQTAPAGQRFAYLFPYAGGASIAGSTYGSHSVWFDAEVASYYASRLPNARILPIFDSADGEAFAAWSEADQRQLADDVADRLIAIGGIAGAHVDIEPFRVEHLPFYDELRQRLHSKAMALTVFTGASTGDIYEVADIVVLSGYDLGLSPVTTAEYETVLGQLVGSALESAAAAGTRLMVGVPIAASYEEYATQSGTCDHDTGFTQEEWFSAALAAVCPHTAHGTYLGLSLWGFYGDALELPRGSGCFRNPGIIPPANWASLGDWGKGACASEPTRGLVSRVKKLQAVPMRPFHPRRF